jgi:hypothetical protein
MRNIDSMHIREPELLDEADLAAMDAEFLSNDALEIDYAAKHASFVAKYPEFANKTKADYEAESQ